MSEGITSAICICGRSTDKKCETCNIKSYCSKKCEDIDRPQHQFQCTPNQLLGSVIDNVASDHQFFNEHKEHFMSGKVSDALKNVYILFRSQAIEEKVKDSYLMVWASFFGRKIAIIYITQEADKLFLFVVPLTANGAATVQGQATAEDRLVISATEMVVNESNTPAKSLIYVIDMPVPEGEPKLRLDAVYS